MSKIHLPAERVLSLASDKISQVLGIAISDKDIEAIFHALHLHLKKKRIHWQVQIPPYRFDISLAEDLMEEIARLYGYDKIPTRSIIASLQVSQGASRISGLACSKTSIL